MAEEFEEFVNEVDFDDDFDGDIDDLDLDD